MPNKTGPEVIREIRQQDASVPIIMVTTEAEKRRVVEAIEAGVTDYLVKPFDADTLKEKVNKYVRGVESRVESLPHRARILGGLSLSAAGRARTTTSASPYL